jgi:autoinducer 2-degrading protein
MSEKEKRIADIRQQEVACYRKIGSVTATMINVIVILEIDPARADEFLEVITLNAPESVKEPGCLRFEVNRQFEQPNLFALSEQYVDQAAMEAHYQTAHFAMWKEKSATGFVTKRWSVKGPVLE